MCSSGTFELHGLKASTRSSLESGIIGNCDSQHHRWGAYGDVVDLLTNKRVIEFQINKSTSVPLRLPGFIIQLNLISRR